jgi:predicted chitinase
MLKIITESQKLLQTWFTLPAMVMLVKVRVGWKFRGRGVIQLTGKTQLRSLRKRHRKVPRRSSEYLGTKMGALESACWYWNSRNINSAADVGDIVKMTKLVNGGTMVWKIASTIRARLRSPKGQNTPRSQTNCRFGATWVYRRHG